MNCECRGKRAQEFDGKKVVSERAIKHLKELARIAKNQSNGISKAAVLMVVNRDDCAYFRACQEACPVFAETMEVIDTTHTLIP